MTKEALGDDSDPFIAFTEVIKQCLVTRDEGWKNYYKSEMDKGIYSEKTLNILEILELEKKAEEANLKGEHNRAHEIVQSIIDKYVSIDTERGWFLQSIARYQYHSSKVESNRFQITAYKHNLSLLRPTKGVEYERMGFISGSRNINIKNWIGQFHDFNELILSLDEVMSTLTFGEKAEKFENGVHEMGKALGFKCQRPDREIKEGPDNLWCLNKNDYFLFECKNEVKESRTEINKLETGQMNNSSGWFEIHYPGCEVKRIMIIPTKTVSSAGAFTNDVEIMRKGKLNLLKKNIREFFKEFVNYDLKDISEEKIQIFLNTHKLDVLSLKQNYSEKAYQSKK